MYLIPVEYIKLHEVTFISDRDTTEITQARFKRRILMCRIQCR